MTHRHPAALAAAALGFSATLAMTFAPLAPGALASSSTSSGSTESASGASPQDLSSAQTSSDGVEVTTYGTSTVRAFQSFDSSLATFAVHGVQRIEGATVVYFSAGSQKPIEPTWGWSDIFVAGAPYNTGGTVTNVRLFDHEAGTALATVSDPRESGPFVSKISAFPDEEGVMGAMFAVLPELAAGTTVVDVQVGRGEPVLDVPVGEGLLEPTADPESVIELGTGWPQIDEAAVAAIVEPESYVYPLSSVTEAMDNSSLTTQQGDAVTIDLAADVLFAFDQADLSPAAQAKIAEVAATLKSQAAPGALSIVGHTDDQGSDAYNDDLSTRRAQAVADALGPQVAEVGLDITVEGRGEREPAVEDNTDEARAANRRVSVGYTMQGDQ